MKLLSNGFKTQAFQTATATLLFAFGLQACGPRAAITPITGPSTSASTNFEDLNQKSDVNTDACAAIGSKDTDGDGICDVSEETEKETGEECITKGDCNGNKISDCDDENSWFQCHWRAGLTMVGGAAILVGVYRAFSGEDWNLWDKEQRQERQSKRISRTLKGGDEIIVDLGNLIPQKTEAFFDKDAATNLAVFTIMSDYKFDETPEKKRWSLNRYEFGDTARICLRLGITDVDLKTNEALVAQTLSLNKDDSETGEFYVRKYQVTADAKVSEDRRMNFGEFTNFCRTTKERGYFMYANKKNKPEEGFLVSLRPENLGIYPAEGDPSKLGGIIRIAYKKADVDQGIADTGLEQNYGFALAHPSKDELYSHTFYPIQGPYLKANCANKILSALLVYTKQGEAANCANTAQGDQPTLGQAKTKPCKNDAGETIFVDEDNSCPSTHPLG